MAEEQTQSNRLEIASAVLLSLAALASSWAGYQAGLWDGEQAAHYSQANAQHIAASNAALENEAREAMDVQAFGGWLDASARGDQALSRFYEARFPPSLKTAFNDWIAEKPLTNAAADPTPFAMASYRRPGRLAADALNRQAAKSFADGQRANAISDAFEQSSTLLSIGLFFGGIGQVFKLPSARIFLLAAATLAVFAGLLRLVSLPAQILGFDAPG